jgi:hypothetical protein
VAIVRGGERFLTTCGWFAGVSSHLVEALTQNSNSNKHQVGGGGSHTGGGGGGGGGGGVRGGGGGG